MAASVEVICNKALSRLGIRQRITTLATDAAAGVPEAVACNDWYSDARDMVLAAFDWPFARVFAQLATATGEAAWDGWSYVFAMPSTPKVIMPRFILPKGVSERDVAAVGSAAREPFVIVKSSQTDSMVVLTDQPTPVLYYVAQLTDFTKFPTEFEDAVVWKLAAEICVPLNADMKRGDYCARRYETRIKEAMAGVWNGFQQEDEIPDSEIILARS